MPSNNQWAEGEDEQVEVNQRALIDKVLARYAAEFTVFRELLQNSDDARAENVEIHFDTQDFLDRESNPDSSTPTSFTTEPGYSIKEKVPDLKTLQVARWTLKNDGIVFRDEDWARLKKIADGNPDEDKIGAFGVGFYSLFSVTEEPVVFSGDRGMRFYFKDGGDQLLVRRLHSSAPTTSSTSPPSATSQSTPSASGAASEPRPWTTFHMPLRTPSVVPNAPDLVRFLSSGLIFMARLRSVSVFLDNHCLARVCKTAGVARKVGVPRGLKTKSPGGTMTVKGLESTAVTIEADVLNLVFLLASERPVPKPAVPIAAKPSGSSGGGGLFSGLWSAFSSRATTPLPPSLPARPEPEVKKVDPLGRTRRSVTLTIFGAEIECKVDKGLTVELVRATKKNPPARLRYELIYTGKSEYDASKDEDAKLEGSAGRVFEGLRADLDGTGAARIFIGHATNQTTGVGGHMSSRFIPTVERESVDLVDRHVAIWNRELLHSGGLLARAAYELELAAVAQLWAGAGPDINPEISQHLTERALHALRFFTFRTSTPSPLVGAEMEKAFFASGPAHLLPVPSTTGPRAAGEVRIPDERLGKFLPRLAVVPKEVMEKAPGMIEALQREGVLKGVGIQDVLAQLRAEPLSQVEGEAFIRWWVGEAPGHAGNSRLERVRAELLNAAVVRLGEGAEERLVQLGNIQNFVDSRKTPGVHIPLDGPLPSTCLPPVLAAPFRGEELKSAFPWQELAISEWLAHVVDPIRTNTAPATDVRHNTAWAERVLQVLGRGWANINKEEQDACANHLREIACIPTTAGIRKPAEAYFPNVNLFPDLAVVSVDKRAPGVDRVLGALGVRKHVELQIVFDRMIKTGDWTVPDLVKYLVSVQSTLSEKEWKKLGATAAFLAEGKTEPDTKTGRAPRWTAAQLYEPMPALREMKLLVLDWGGAKWKSTSEEAKFLFNIGLRRHPALEMVLGLAAGQDEVVRGKALKYFLDHFAKQYSNYKPSDFAHLAFVPCKDSEGRSRLEKPTEVFAYPEWASLGFAVVDLEYKEVAVNKMKIREHPPSTMLVSVLQATPPRTVEDATKWFEALASRIPYFSDTELRQLAAMSIVPARAPKTGKLTNVPPSQCYFLREGARASVHSKLFASVDFGPRANGFLAALGAKEEPSVDEVAQMLLRSPREFWTLADGRDAFLAELRNIAVNRRAVSAPVYTRMKRAPILLGARRKRKEGEKAGLGEDEEDVEFEYDLMRPDEIVIADDTNEWQLFGDEVFCCPQEDLLESFYADLGSRRLSSLVKEEYRTSQELRASKIVEDTRKLVLQRLPLFLHDHQHDGQRLSYSWLNNEGNFVVRAFGKVNVEKTLQFGKVRVRKVSEASAVAKQEGSTLLKGQVQLWISSHTQVDMFEVANSLCRLLFKTPRKNDALLFSAILSTDISSLKRRGYNVERILRQQRAERQAAEEAARAARPQSTALVSDTASTSGIPGGFEKPAPPIPVASKPMPQPPASTSAPISSYDSTPTIVDDAIPEELSSKGGRPNSMISQFNNLKSKFTKKGSNSPLPGAGLLPGMSSDVDSSSGSGQSANPSGHVTPLTNINANIQNAIKACRPETRGLMRNREQMQTIRETLDDGYCDVAGKAGDLQHIGTIGEIKVYAAPDVPDLSTLMHSKKDSLSRFIHIIRALGQVYALPPTSLHIFYDVSGSLIAFNSSGSLFCNLRYYEAWHDQDVARGDLSGAYISWYFTLAHEIAHNLVQPHNSEHEFYFSAICEAHLLAFGKLLGGRR